MWLSDHLGSVGVLAYETVHPVENEEMAAFEASPAPVRRTHDQLQKQIQLTNRIVKSKNNLSHFTLVICAHAMKPKYQPDGSKGLKM